MRKRMLLIMGVMIIVFSLACKSGNTQDVYFPTDTWRNGTPEEQGFSSEELTQLLQVIQDRGTDIDSLLIIRNGYVILDAYFYPYNSNLRHDLASMTKSFTTTLIGIASDQGLLSLDDTMISFFPDRTIANVDTRKESITVRNLASMRNGLQSGCMAGDQPTINSMIATDDWLQWAVDRPMVADPDTTFCYDSPGMHILSGILSEVSGKSTQEFARQNLFDKLNITGFYWDADPDGIARGWGDLLLKPIDVAKLGYLWLQGGEWNGEQIVSRQWIEEAVQEYSNKGTAGYGYGWWVYDDNYSAQGRDGQYLKVFPDWNLIIVITGHGMELDEIAPYLEASFIDPDAPLPAYPEGVAALQAKVLEVAEGLPEKQSGPLPDIASQVSGRVYTMDENPDGITSLQFRFDDTLVASLTLSFGIDEQVVPIGLDGNYIQSEGRFACRGYWVDETTFSLELFTGMRPIFRTFTFTGDQVDVTAEELRQTYSGLTQIP